jgi:hypothetical protein
MSARLLSLGDSELMPQHQDLGVLPPRLPPPQAQQRHSTSDNQEDQLQSHEPKIIPQPLQAPRAKRSGEHPPRRRGFSAPTAPAGDVFTAAGQEFRRRQTGQAGRVNVIEAATGKRRNLTHEEEAAF